MCRDLWCPLRFKPLSPFHNPGQHEETDLYISSCCWLGTTEDSFKTTLQFQLHCQTLQKCRSQIKQSRPKKWRKLSPHSLLCSSHVLSSADFDRPLFLQTSNRGVSAVLSQKDWHYIGMETPVAYFSRNLLPREEHFMKKYQAIKLATNSFRVYLLGRPFTV